MDNEATVENLKQQVQAFCEERDWDQFHTPKELAIGISTEANELLQLFRFKSQEQVEDMLASDKREDVEDELADTLFFILRFAQMNDIDLSDALASKLSKNAAHYPAELSRGRNDKYDAYTSAAGKTGGEE